MSKKTRREASASARRYVGRRRGGSSAGGIVLPREQIDDVVDVLVDEFGEEKAEGILCAAEREEISFVEHLWREKMASPERIYAMCQAAKLSGEKPQRPRGAFDPCFQPETWPWEADAAKRREATEKYAQQRVAAALASAEGRQKVAYNSARAKNTIAAALSRLGIQDATGADGRTFLCADLLEAPWERFGDIGRAFLSALMKEVRSKDRARSQGASGAYLLLEGEVYFAAAYSASRAAPPAEEAAFGATKAPVGGWHPNSAESDAAPPAQTVERDSSVFPVEADFQFELRDAKNNAGTFEKKRVGPAERAAKAWEGEEDADALAGATLYFNLGTRLCALGAAKPDGAAIASAIEYFRKAKGTEAAAKKGDPALAAKIHHSLGYALFTAAETTGDLAGFQASAEASKEAAETYARADDPKRCGYARFNLALALTALANRTGRVSDFREAAGGFAEAAEMYAKGAEPRESASALHRQGLIQLELGRRTGDAAAFREAATVSAEAAKRFVAVDDVRTSAAARDNQTVALTEAGDLEAAAAAASEAAVRHAESGNTLGCAHAKFREGHALSELARAVEGSEPLQNAVEALAAAERGYVESGSERDLASALHNQGVCLLELGDRTGDSDAYLRAANIFIRATKSHLEVGAKENGAVTEYYRGVALLNCAAIQGEQSAFRESAEASATAASITQGSPGGEEWYANARYNQGTAILELAKRTNKGADFQEAAAVLEEAARCLRSAGHTERGAEAEAARELALAALRELAGTSKFDSDARSVVTRSGESTGAESSKGGEDQPITHDVAAPSPGALSSQFEKKAAALAAAQREALEALATQPEPSVADVARVLLPAPTPSQVAIDKLADAIRAAQRTPPEDKLQFVWDVRRLLAAAGLELRVAGESRPVTVALKNGSLALAGTRSGTSGFRGKNLVVVRSEEPRFAPGPRVHGQPSPS